ncbi:hypothetical protein C1646_755437 [Rhizophagus diaphanus]|nr:hypothetical protein C1646_755437 [Rhizophagus diaphanus] [Rhizophagus sp. MUCL 43196]
MWQNGVIQETIYNCWKYTGILPLVNQEEVDEKLTDEEIISLVNLDKNELEVESDEEIPSVILKVQALNNLDNLVIFFKYSSLNNSINQSELNTLQKLRHEVLRSHITDLK